MIVVGRFLVCVLMLGQIGMAIAATGSNQHALGKKMATGGTYGSTYESYQHKGLMSESILPEGEIYQKADEVLKRRGYRIVVIQIAKDKNPNSQNTSTQTPITQSQKNWYLHITAERGGHRYAVKIHYPSFKVISEKRL